MSRTALSILAVIALGVAASACSSGAGYSAPPAPARPVAAAPSNTTCPVMGRPIDPSVPTSVYRGQVIGFCCAGCKPTFDANPEAYAGNIR